MIGYLRGGIIQRQEQTLILNVHGVGYVVYVNARRMASWHDEVALWIETVVREHSIELYGFETPQEQRTFLDLQKVPGLGPKMAMLILSSFESLSELYQAIQGQHLARFKAISGIGAKLATRIVQELQNLPELQSTEALQPHTDKSGAFNTALEALTALGYDSSISWKVLMQVAQEFPEGSAETYVKHVLQAFIPDRERK